MFSKIYSAGLIHCALMTLYMPLWIFKIYLFIKVYMYVYSMTHSAELFHSTGSLLKPMLTYDTAEQS